MTRKRNPQPDTPPDPPAQVAPEDVPLTPSEEVFLEEYLVDLNGTRAYRVAFPGGTYGAARAGASRLLAKANIAAEIRAARAAQSRRTRVGADRVLRELARVAFSDLAELFGPDGAPLPLRRVPLEARRAVASVRISRERVTTRTTKKGKTTTRTTTREQVIEYRLWDKVGALEKLCRHLGLDTPISPLDAFLLALPPALAAQVRAAMVAGREGSGAGGGHLTAPGQPERG